MGKKKKGRGRGRGGRGDPDKPQVGQGKSTEQDEPRRPGEDNEQKKTQEDRAANLKKREDQPQPQKTTQQQNPTHPTTPPLFQNPTLPQNPTLQPQKHETPLHKQKAPSEGATGIQNLCDMLNRTSLNDEEQMSRATKQQTGQQGQGRQNRKGKRANQQTSDEKSAAINKPAPAGLFEPQQMSSNDKRQDHSEQLKDSKYSSDRKGVASTSLAGNTSIPPGNSTRNGRQVVSSAITEEKPSHVKQQAQPLPCRPGYGDLGMPIKLKANFFKLDFGKVDFLYHYDIDIKPEKAPVSECRKVVNAAIEKYLNQYFDNHRPAFDGKKNLYSRIMLPSINGQGCELDVVIPGEKRGKEKHFKLTVKYAAQIPVEDLMKFLDEKLQGKSVPEAVQALDIVLRHKPSLQFTPVGRSFFPMSNPGLYLGGGCEVRTGFYQSVRPSQWKTMLVNIDVSSKGFMKAQKVINLLCEICKIREEQITGQWKMKQYQEKVFLDAIKGFKVETSHIPDRKRKYLVCGLGENAHDYKFSLENESGSKQMISVKDYFQKTYNINLRYPQLPCLIVGQKKNHLPMEVCEMVESQKRRLTDEQTAAMIRKVTCPARDRKRDIEKWAKELEEISSGYLQDEFGLKINRDMVEVDGRVLPAPNVSLGDEGTIVPRNGVWDMRDKKFFQGAAVNVWAMVCFVDPKRSEGPTRKFANVLADVCSKEGMKMNKCPCDVKYPHRNDTVQDVLKSLVSKHKDLQLILVVLPDQGNKEKYKEVKCVAETDLGIPTQCVQTKQFLAAKPQVCSNIAMKINAKLGGINHIVNSSSMPALFQNVIVFGADVTHPSPGESNIPSLAAVVASIDFHASKYAARVRAQTHMKDKSVQEIILEMRVMVKDLLIEFYKATGKTKPQKIIFYRDGVSEGQFGQVLEKEVKAVQQACLDIQKDGQYQPAITFVVVQKRHHVRLFCADKKDESGKAGNVPPGTMVDRGITHPYEFDFYLCSHQGIQGTSRPTHYHVLYDDNNFDANSLQKLTYYLCHTYARCTRTVSMPAPAHYAHLAAFRARHHLNGIKTDKELLEVFQKAIKVNDKLKQKMYFA